MACWKFEGVTPGLPLKTTPCHVDKGRLLFSAVKDFVYVASRHLAISEDVSVQQVPDGHSRNAKWTPSPPVQRAWIGTTTEPPAAGPAAASAAAPTAAPALR